MGLAIGENGCNFDNVNDRRIIMDKGYICRWRLEDNEGKTRIENFKCDSLEHFESIYGNNSDKILWVTLRQEGQAML